MARNAIRYRQERLRAKAPQFLGMIGGEAWRPAGSNRAFFSLAFEKLAADAELLSNLGLGTAVG